MLIKTDLINGNYKSCFHKLYQYLKRKSLFYKKRTIAFEKSSWTTLPNSDKRLAEKRQKIS